jgi:L-amino acid N-acyltransferase YncA
LLTVTAIDVRDLRRRDWPAVAAIFAEGIASGDATFETRVPTWDEWDAAHLDDHRLVATAGNELVGWAALAPYSRRPAYAGVAEESVYVAESARGRGVGRALLETLIARTEAAGIWTLQAGIFPENKASLKLHFACGFRTVGLRQRLGRTSDGAWRDVVLLERRSRAL